MSRIGRMPVAVPSGVDVRVDGQRVTVRGPKGELVRTFHPLVEVAQQDGRVAVRRRQETQEARAIHGLSRTLLANMVTGVTAGYQRDLEISGTGYRAALAGKKLQLSLGFSHPVEVEPPAGISFSLDSPQKVRVSGTNKELVGEVAAKIRALRVPDPYKAKGIKYAGERIRRKAGKAGKVGAKA
jgi:large subunit ribosomal protein L6